MSEIKLRLANLADADQIQAIYAPFITENAISFEEIVPSVEEMKKRIQVLKEKYPYLVAEDQSGKILGYAYASPFHERSAYRWSVNVTVYLHPDARKKGLGTVLYDHLIHILKEQGFTMAYALITRPNLASEALHKKLGFSLIGTYHEVGFKLGRWHDVGRWEMNLKPPGTGRELPKEPKLISDLLEELNEMFSDQA